MPDHQVNIHILQLHLNWYFLQHFRPLCKELIGGSNTTAGISSYFQFTECPDAIKQISFTAPFNNMFFKIINFCPRNFLTIFLDTKNSGSLPCGLYLIINSLADYPNLQIIHFFQQKIKKHDRSKVNFEYKVRTWSTFYCHTFKWSQSLCESQGS